MSNNWQCPHCSSVNVKPDYVLQLEKLQQSLGVVGFGTTGEQALHCAQCSFEADINAMLRGEYDYAGEISARQVTEEKTKVPSSTSTKTVQSDRLALFMVGGSIVALICIGVLIVAGGGWYMSRTGGDAIPPPLPQSTVRSTFTPRAVVTVTGLPSVRILNKADAQKLVEEQDTPFLASKAVETYSSDELNQMGLALTYTIHLAKSEPLGWGMGWCTTTESILHENFDHISYVFTLNGKNVPVDQFVEVEYYSENAQGYCRQYYTVLTDWKPGEYVIKTVIKYDQPINDGWDDYPAGSKTHEYHVIVP